MGKTPPPPPHQKNHLNLNWKFWREKKARKHFVLGCFLSFQVGEEKKTTKRDKGNTKLICEKKEQRATVICRSFSLIK